jgi:hypothetical protein
MPRDGVGAAQKPSDTTAIPDTTIESSMFNLIMSDVYNIFNTVTPVIYGGTGVNNLPAFLVNLGALPLAGGTLTGALLGTTATFSGALTANGLVSTGTASVTGLATLGSLSVTGVTTLTGAVTFGSAQTFSFPVTTNASTIHGETALTDAATVAWNLGTGGPNYSLTMTAGVGATRTLGAFTGGTAGQCGTLRIIEDATGGRALDLVNYASAFSGGQIDGISTGANDQTLYDFQIVAGGTMKLSRRFMTGKNTIGFYKEYSVADPPAINQTYQIPHGLGQEPAFVQVLLKCKTAEHGWTTGQKLDGSTLPDSSGSGANLPPQIGWDTTNVYIATNQLNMIAVRNATTRAIGIITPANWELMARVYE